MPRAASSATVLSCSLPSSNLLIMTQRTPQLLAELQSIQQHQIYFNTAASCNRTSRPVMQHTAHSAAAVLAD
jgi:hypothetical protein